MAGPYSRAARRGCAGMLLQIALVPIAMMLVFSVPALVSAVLPAESPLRFPLVMISFLGAMIAFVVLALGFASLRTRVLDPAFQSIGIAASGLLPNIREYHGMAFGRRLDAMYARRRGILEIALGARSVTKVSIGQGAVARTARELVGLSVFPSSDPELAGLVVGGADPRWASTLLADRQARDAILALMREPSEREVRWINVRPGAVCLVRQWVDPDLAGASIGAQVDALGRLAAAIDRLPPPPQAIAPGRLEGAFRRSPTRSAFVLVLIILGMITAPATCLVGALAMSTQSEASVTPTPTAPQSTPDPRPREHRRRGR